jgi:hypothetical protein
MDDLQFQQYCEKKLAMKQYAKQRIAETGAVRQQWTCDDCGSVLSWDSTEHRQRHYKSRKHTQKAEGRIPK